MAVSDANTLYLTPDSSLLEHCLISSTFDDTHETLRKFSLREPLNVEISIRDHHWDVGAAS